ncbi:hypothetical protein [Namhaeicola litoreus]|uniref:Polysaccharide (De)acetylase n=1 Tax=Namhaeicola litoreus TaxID=1052145 RepID=A0ABW3Y2K5_9FLAO
MKQKLFNHIKNIPGWKSKRKIVLFSVDDYGNVRLDSQKARKELDKAGLKVSTRFDAYDTLETKEDLEQLFEILNSVKDAHEKPAVFTPYALPCNIDFERIKSEEQREYFYELLPQTFSKLEDLQTKAYLGTWPLWLEGINKGFLKPQFHGREHLNLVVFKEKLKTKDKDLMVNLENRSYTSIEAKNYEPIGYTAAFSFRNQDDQKDFPDLMETGLDAFEKVFGYPATVFTPPAGQFPVTLEGSLSELGLQHLDKPFYTARHLGNDQYKKEINVLGFDHKSNLTWLVRNVVFEPTDDRGLDWVTYTFQQVEAAFFWGKPANISSHRVNFCGHIDPKNRAKGLGALKELLKRIVQKWPEVEFMSADALGDLILEERRRD